MQLYHANYDNKNRFISYYHQLRIIESFKPKSILEIGVGNSVLADILKRQGYSVITADVDKSLNPDFVVDLGAEIKLPKNFDLIAVFQTLEHVPFDKAIDALKCLSRKCKRIVISIPLQTMYFSCEFKLPFTKEKKGFILQIQKFWSTAFLSKEHQWELGTKKFPKNKFYLALDSAGLVSEYEFFDRLNPYHLFFVIRAKN